MSRSEPSRETSPAPAAGAGGAGPVASIVIVNYNGRHHLERCLPSVFATAEPAFEVIVVDNASTDGSVEWLQTTYPEVRLLAMEGNLGFGAGCHQGVEVARGEVIVFLNSDTEVEPGWLAELLRPLEECDDVAATCSLLRLLEHPELLNARGGGMSRLGFGYDRDFGFPYRPPAPEDVAVHDVIFPTAAAMAIRRAEFLEVGGFDPAFFMYHEDVDLGWRLWMYGRRVVLCERSVVRHSFGGTTRAVHSLAWRERLGLRHNVRTLLKHYEPLHLLKALKGLLVLRVGHHGLGHIVNVAVWNLLKALQGLLVLRHTRRVLGLFFHIGWWNLVRLPGTLGMRRRIQRRRRLVDEDLFERGLIDFAPYPPPHPEVPRAEPARNGAGLLAPAIFPGRDSALGRLGIGWYAREDRRGERVRATCGEAVAFLRAAPHAHGRLTATVRVPEALEEPQEVVLSAAGRRSRALVEPGKWTPISLTATAGRDGTLEVLLESPTWVPHEHARDWDFRRTGVRVKEIRFEPARRPSMPRYRSASVVLPTYNRREVLEQTLEALGRQTVEGLELVVVDDGSTDGTWERLEAWKGAPNGVRMRIARQPNQGPGAARNHGVSLASEDLVIFLGDDVIPDPDWAEAHLRRHGEIEDPVAVLGFTDWHREAMRVTPVLELINLEGQQFGYGRMTDGGDVPFTCFYTSNISVPRWVLGERPFDPTFTRAAWEDTELGYRLSLEGLRIVYCRDARARHLHPTSLARFFARQREVGRHRALLDALHPELENVEDLPARQPPHWYRPVRRLVPLLVPPLSGLDRTGLPLPRGLVRRVLQCGYYLGRDEPASAAPAPSGPAAAVS